MQRGDHTRIDSEWVESSLFFKSSRFRLNTNIVCDRRRRKRDPVVIYRFPTKKQTGGSCPLIESPEVQIYYLSLHSFCAVAVLCSAAADGAEEGEKVSRTTRTIW